MATYNLSPLGGAGWQFFGEDGLPLNAGLLFTYIAGTTTPADTYDDSLGTTLHSNPIVLGSTGRPPAEIWLTSGTAYKFIIKTSANALIATYDNVYGINDVSLTSSMADYLASPPTIGGTTPGAGNFTYVNVTGPTVPANGIYEANTDELGFASHTIKRGGVNSTGKWTLGMNVASGASVQINGAVGSHSTTIADAAGTQYSVGYLEAPQVSQTSNYAAVLSDSGKHILMNGTSITLTIPANASVAYPIGTILTAVNLNSTSLSIAITSDTMTKAGSTTTGTRTLAQNGIASILKTSATGWLITGTGLS
jgi:hypothetical protein